jgi:ribA/ribD-fused uncharacterized protein
MKIDKFTKEYSFLSNFFPVKIIWKGITFPTVEHAFVASKSNNPLFWDEISKLPAKSGGYAKKKGRKITLRNNWEKIKVIMMEEFLRQKFRYPHLEKKLINTYPNFLEEGNTWHDNFWGNCYCNKCKSIEGRNILGKLLMKIREEKI